jgi:hypothetical protein
VRNVLTVAVLLTVACGELEPTLGETCGNGVLDPEAEDCDGYIPQDLPDGRCGGPRDEVKACRLICASNDDCPAGWTCSPDDVCHHASGLLDAVSSGDLPVTHWAARDVDGDGSVDLVGLGGGFLAVLLADGTGGFEPLASQPASATRYGRPTFGDLDADGRSDAAVPGSEGILLFAGTSDRSEPLRSVISSATLFGGNADSVTVHVIQPATSGHSRGHSVLQLAQLDSEIRVLLGTATEHLGTSAPVIPGWSSLDSITGAVGDLDGDSFDEVVLLHTAAPAELLVLRTEARPAFLADHAPVLCLELGPTACTRVALGIEPLRTRPVLADLDGDGHRDVIVTLAPGRLAWLRSSGMQLEPPEELTIRIVEDRTGRTAAVRPSRPLLASDLDRDGILDWVTPEGVLLGRDSGTWPTLDTVRIASSDRGLGGSHAAEVWVEAVQVDLNGDPWPDLAVTTTEAGEPTSLLLYRAHCLDVADRQCRRLTFSWEHVHTDGSPRELRAGEFDGDPPEDVAFIDSRPGEEHVRIRFSASGLGPAETRTMWRDLEPGVRMEAGLLDLDGTTDLVIVARPQGEAERRTVRLLGRPSRTAYAPLRVGAGFNDFPPALDVWAGAFELPGAQALAVADLDTRLFRVFPPVFGGSGAVEPGPIYERRLTCKDPLGSTLGAVAWTPFAVDDGREKLVGVWPRAECADAPDEVWLMTYAPLERIQSSGPVPGIGPARAIAKGDADDDGHPDLVVADASGVHVLFGPDFVDSARLFAALEPPSALAFIQADADPRSELAVLTEHRVHLVDLGGRGATATELATLDLGGTSLDVADMNNDGLADLLVGDGRYVHILHTRPHRPPRGASP